MRSIKIKILWLTKIAEVALNVTKCSTIESMVD